MCGPPALRFGRCSRMDLADASEQMGCLPAMIKGRYIDASEKRNEQQQDDGAEGDYGSAEARTHWWRLMGCGGLCKLPVAECHELTHRKERDEWGTQF